MTRFVVCGEALMDFCLNEQDPPDSFRSTWDALSAGGPMNTAAALAELGADAHFLGRLSTDFFGAQLRDHITKAGVDLDLVVTRDDFTSLAILMIDEQGKATYAFHLDGTANFQWQPDELPALTADDWLHVGTLATVVEPGASVLAEWAANQPSRISFDINVRPTVITDPEVYWQRVLPWLEVVGARTGIVKASDDDLDFLARGSGDTGSAEEVAAAWARRFGFGLAVVTRGDRGAVAYTADGGTSTHDGFRAGLVDTVGAGDTFMAGFLDSHLRDPDDIVAALERGCAAAAIVVGRLGAQPPTAAEVDALIGAAGR
ncbi:MAG: carbohydrate kinase family protein [Propionibacteriaceae bacterium]